MTCEYVNGDSLLLRDVHLELEKLKNENDW